MKKKKSLRERVRSSVAAGAKPKRETKMERQVRKSVAAGPKPKRGSPAKGRVTIRSVTPIYKKDIKDKKDKK